MNVLICFIIIENLKSLNFKFSSNYVIFIFISVYISAKYNVMQFRKIENLILIILYYSLFDTHSKCTENHTIEKGIYFASVVVF